jgi:hypothetical protein
MIARFISLETHRPHHGPVCRYPQWLGIFAAAEL